MSDDGKTAPTTNTGVVVFDAALRTMIDIGVKATETALPMYLPFLGLPIVQQLDNAFLEWLGDKYYKAIADEGTYLILKFETYVDRTNYKKSLLDLKEAQDSGEPLKLQAAKLAFAEAASQLIHNNGSVRP